MYGCCTRVDDTMMMMIMIMMMPIWTAFGIRLIWMRKVWDSCRRDMGGGGERGTNSGVQTRGFSWLYSAVV